MAQYAWRGIGVGPRVKPEDDEFRGTAVKPDSNVLATGMTTG